jgi:MFS family permease
MPGVEKSVGDRRVNIATSKSGMAPGMGQVPGIVVGSALEFYDFLIYVYYAVYIGKAIFPAHDATSSLLASLAVLGIGFLTRPLGAVVLGLMGDRKGRKPALLLSFSLIGFADAGLALTPSYAKIGVMAQVLVVFFRLLQGFAVGGEIGPSTAFLLETAPTSRRGLFTSMQFVSQACGAMLAAGVGVVLSRALGVTAFAAYAWRIAFLLGVLIVPVGLWLRNRLTESLPGAQDDRDGDDPASETNARGKYVKVIAIGFTMLAAGAMSGSLQNYMTTYAVATLGMSSSVAFTAALLAGPTTVVLCILSGHLSDRIGRRPMMIAPTVILAVLIIPIFRIMVHLRSAGSLYAGVVLINALISLGFTPIFIYLSEAMPPRARAASIGIVYAITIAVFGGSTQFVVTWLIAATGNHMMPALLWELVLIVCLTGMVLAQETAPITRRRNPRLDLE